MTPTDQHKIGSIMEQATKRVEAAARRSSEAKQWEALVQRLALALNCMPSSFVDGNEHLFKAIAAILADLEAAEVALNRIASWPEGEQVTQGFDEPNAASIARDCLSRVSDAEGAQTFPIPCEVFAGGSRFKKGAPFCDVAEHIEAESKRLVWAMEHMGMSNDCSRNFTAHVLSVGGTGDIHDCRTFIDAAMASHIKAAGREG
jgi:hypothetical protein